MSGRDDATPLDRGELEQASLGDAAFERELLVEFLAGSQALIAELGEALAARDAQELGRAAHSLKGSCWTIGARPMGRACELLEADAREGRLDGAGAAIDRIREHLVQVESHVRRLWAL
ncbi:MAG: Hpt domain-containing protein [Thermodesulfobacteriota bacterium]